MKITVDTNVLVRAAIRDDNTQAEAAAQTLREASIAAVPLVSLCEFVWVVRRFYGFSRADTVVAVQSLLQAANVAVDRPAVEAGLAALNAGADFADGVIAFQGRWLGGETFVSFDRKAVSVLEGQDLATRLLR